MNNWGGARKGAGRPVGWRKAKSEMRPQRQLRAHDDEWQIIKAFAEIVKHGNKQAAIDFVSC